jgi:hypothetical protein
MKKYGRNIKKDSSLAASVDNKLTRRPLSEFNEVDFSLKVFIFFVSKFSEHFTTIFFN